MPNARHPQEAPLGLSVGIEPHELGDMVSMIRRDRLPTRAPLLVVAV
jgi:hypothetical protein